MQLQTLKLTKLSICPCGYAVLLDSILVGAEYVVDVASIRDGFTYICGKCGTVHTNVRIVQADQPRKPMGGMKPLPADLFGL